MPGSSGGAAVERVIVGRLGSPFGVKGWIRVHSHTRPAEQLFDYPLWGLGESGELRELAVEAAQAQGKGWIARLGGIADRDAAAELTGAMISVSRTMLPRAEQGAYYWIDLIGLRVVSTQGFDFGRVDSLMETGANDVLVVHGDAERLIPFVQPDVIQRIDLSAGVIEVDWDPDF